jgi:secreted trypsin-like serine protease
MVSVNRKRILVAIVLLIALVAGVTPVLAITWGQPDTEHDNVGAMVVDHPDFGPYQWCSGTLVHPQVFLTAGHCTFDLADYGISTVWVNFDQDANNVATLRLVDQVITHPDYNWGPTSNPHDLAALVLVEPATDIAPANLPYEGLLDDLRAAGVLSQRGDRASFTLVGYGGTLEWPPPLITYDDERQYAVSEYRALLGSWLRMSQNKATGDGGTCYGDSGGPSFWTDPASGDEILVGVTSWGDAQCVSSAFNYRVDTADALDFIADVIANLP